MTDQAQNQRLADKVRNELKGALVPILIAVIAYMGKLQLDEIKTELRKVPEYTQKLAVLEAGLSVRQELALKNDTRQERFQDHLISVDKRVQTLETTSVELTRRVERLERY